MNRVIITGVAGFIGSNLARTLLESGHEVIGIDNYITGQPTHIQELNRYPTFRFIKHDIVKPFTKSQFKQLNAAEIYHLACPTGVPNLTLLGEEMLTTSSEGTRNVLELARKSGAKIVFTSSSEVYGNPLLTPQAETYTGNVDPTGVRSTYEEGKRFAEATILLYVRKYNVKATIARLFNVYGPGMAVAETRVIPRMVSQAITNKPMTVHGEGKQTRTFCYVDDLVNGLILLMEKGTTGEVYNLGSAEAHTIHEIATLIKDLTHSTSPISSIERPSHDHDSRKPDLTKITQLGWKPTVSLTAGLEKTIKYCKVHLARK